LPLSLGPLFKENIALFITINVVHEVQNKYKHKRKAVVGILECWSLRSCNLLGYDYSTGKMHYVSTRTEYGQLDIC